VQAGRFDRQVKVEHAESVQDEAGQPIEAWGEVATVWAMREPLKGTEKFEELQEMAFELVKFTLRWQADALPTPDETWRLYDYEDDRYFDLRSVQQFGRRVGLTIIARARAE